MSTLAAQLPQCAFCEKKASYVWGSEAYPTGRIKDKLYTCLTPSCVVQARGYTLFEETDASKET